MNVEGGYLIHKHSLIRAGLTDHTAALERPVSDGDLAALNAIQAVPWRINHRVLDVALALYEMGSEAAGLPSSVRIAMPARLPEAEWEVMPEEVRRAHNARRRELHEARVAHAGKLQSLLDKLNMAQEMRDQDEIWFPHSRDFRGRIYPLAMTGPHPQADDLGRNLIEFARGCELGEDGLYWLCVRAANAAGHDKLPLAERYQWALDHWAVITACGTDPLGENELAWWSGLDSPWEFLATAFELSDIGDWPPETFVSHLPIPLDGTCNGLQHLSAMGLDPIGARATNLSNDPVRHDIYQHVADIVAKRVESDAAAGVQDAYVWLGKVNRKTVKRAVMTTPYGVTDRGIRTQLIADGVVPVDGAERGPAAEYLKDCLVAALSQTIEAGKGIMAWFQAVAYRLAKAGLYFEWPTPSGSIVRQAYHVLLSQRVSTLCGKIQLNYEDPDGMLNPKKQALGSAPNVVHSYDAAHLAITVTTLAEQGVRDFAMIHDSFGTHAGNTTRMSWVLRSAFADIYKKDWLQVIADYVADYAPHVELPPVPPRGAFDISEVEEAQFFFS